jgi:hypothetical protein
MGMALQIPGANPILKSHPTLHYTSGDYTYAVETHGDQTVYTVSDGTRSVTHPIVWGFGSGNQTWVYEQDGKYYESLVSYYAPLSGLAMTTGDENRNPHTVEEAAGRELFAGGEAKDCFGCHSSNSAVEGQLRLASVHPGVNCQQCHKGTDIHLADILKGKQDSIPDDLSNLSTDDMSDFCGRCHRTWERIARGKQRGEIDVRFQPYRLANSQCYDGTDPRISCIACHDVHKPVASDQSFYDAKCVACHSTSARPVSTAPLVKANLCPVAKSKCISCHMPKVDIPGGHLRYTDHEIRIVRAGEAFPD